MDLSSLIDLLRLQAEQLHTRGLERYAATMETAAMTLMELGGVAVAVGLGVDRDPGDDWPVHDEREC